MIVTQEENLRDFTLDQWVLYCHGRAVKNNWWSAEQLTEQDPTFMASKIALIHSEVSEMLEGLRKGLPDDHLPHRSAEEVEAADVFIRLVDYCGARKIDLAAAVTEKMHYNETRADHKPDARGVAGGKKF